MFSKNFNCRNAFVNNIDNTTRKKPVHIQKDNDIFNQRNLSAANINSNTTNQRYLTELSTNKAHITDTQHQQQLISSNINNIKHSRKAALSVEINPKNNSSHLNYMLSRNAPSHNLNVSQSLYNERYKNYNTFTSNNNNDSVGELLSYDKSYETFYKKNNLHKPLSSHSVIVDANANDKDKLSSSPSNTYTKLKHTFNNNNNNNLKHLSINELFESTRKTHLNYSTNINPEIAQYDINEMTNYIKSNNIQDKIKRRAELTSKATQALMYAENNNENRSKSLQHQMESSQSRYDKHLLNKAKLKLKQKILELNIQQCNMQMKNNNNNGLQRREITDYYKMNDKIVEKKLNAYKNCNDSINENNFKAMKYLAVPNNCYPNRNNNNNTQRNKLPFHIDGNYNNNNRYKNK